MAGCAAASPMKAANIPTAGRQEPCTALSCALPLKRNSCRTAEGFSTPFSVVQLAHRTFFAHNWALISWRHRLAVGPNVVHMARAPVCKVDLYQAGLARRI
jgi:hypothetical protein